MSVSPALHVRGAAVGRVVVNWLEITASIVVCWIMLSVVFVVAWARFMEHVAHKERELVHASAPASPISLEAYQRAA